MKVQTREGEADPSHYPLSTYISLSIFSLVGNGGQDLTVLFSPLAVFSQTPGRPFQGAPQGSPLAKTAGSWWILKEADSQKKGRLENDRYGARDRETEKGERSNYPLQAVFRVTPKTGVGVSSPVATRKPPLLETSKRQEPLLSKNPCQKKKGYCDSPSFVFEFLPDAFGSFP